MPRDGTLTRQRSGLAGALLAGAVMLGLVAVPLFSVAVPPLGDYPNHLARMHVLAHIADSQALQANYVVAWHPSPYLAMDVIVPALAQVMRVETAGRIFLLLALGLQLAGTMLLHRKLSGRWSAWPAAGGLGMFGYLVHLGFANYLFGIGAALCGFALWVASDGWRTRWRLAAALPAALLVYFSHYFAFFAFGLCLTAWEAQAWFAIQPRRLAGLVRRAVAVGAVAVLPLSLFATLESEPVDAGTMYGGIGEQAYGLLAPTLFPGSRFDFLLIGFAALAVLAGLVTRRLAVDRRMVPVLVLVGVAGLATPQMVDGVWGMQFRMPVIWWMLAVAALRPVGAPRAWMAAGAVAVALFAGHVGTITQTWQPRARQYEELRAALPLMPKGVRLLAFWVPEGGDPAIARGPFFSFSQMPAMAVIDRDVFLPFLYKLMMMTVRAAPRTLAIDSPHGRPIPIEDLWVGADTTRGPLMLGAWNNEGQRVFWGDWPRHYDYALELHFGATVPLPPALRLVHRGSFFSIHEVAYGP